MQNLKPGAIALLAGGGLLFISSLVNWGPDTSGISTDFFGLQGLFCLVIGGGVVTIAAIRAFAPQVSLPSSVLGLSLMQAIVGLGLAAFLITFGLQFVDGSEFGVTLGWIGSAAIVAGGIMESTTAQTSSAPPTPF
ncbi:MAG: hypothetical protein OEU32_01230 [Acidimicrobiia bacterium]|nr:hypothetical protein [Acidimicrobiia bacterium]